MDRRRFLRAALATSVGSFLSQDSSIMGAAAEAKRPRKRAGGFETIGLYVSLPTDPPPKNPRIYEFFKACGYNYLEFCEAGFRRSADLTPEQVLDQYAGLISDEKTRVALGRVLRYIENHSNWQNSLPASYRLRNFEVPEVTSASAALKLLAQVKPCVRPAIPLLEPPALYLGRLKKRLQAIADENVGSTAPIRTNMRVDGKDPWA